MRRMPVLEALIVLNVGDNAIAPIINNFESYVPTDLPPTAQVASDRK